MTMDPYKTLGVPRTADQATIKRVGKRKKVASHPDHGGDREQYEAASRALVVLTDPLRKYHYDTTGKADFEPADLRVQALSDIIMPLLNDAIIKGDPERMPDLIGRIGAIIKSQIVTSRIGKTQAIAVAEKIERVARRFKKKGDTAPGGMIHEALMAQAGNMRFQAQAADQVIAANELALTILAEHSFDAIVEASQSGLIITSASSGYTVGYGL